MGKVAQFFDSGDRPQLLGCWGYGQPSDLERLRSTVSAIDSRSSVGLSAAHFFTEIEQADAWVKFTDDRLILGREAFGRVPLYWMQIDQVIWFSSQVQLLLPLLETRSMSLPGLYSYTCFSYVTTPLTSVENIFSIPSGTEQSWQGDQILERISQPQSKRLIEWQEASKILEDETLAITQLQTLLKHAVDRQIQDLNNEPVGVFLSGGLDSSIVAALLVQAGIKVHAYTLDFGPNAGTSEYPYAEQLAQWLNIPLTKVDASPKRIRQAMVSTVKAIDSPFGDGVTVPLFLLSQAASQETQVIFNGEGGDQLFAGWANKPLIAAGVYQPQEPFMQQYLRTFHRLWGYEAQIYQPDVYAQIQHLQPQDWLQDALDPSFTTALLHRLRRATLMLKGAQNIHPRATALGWAHGLKVRSPFCDQPLVEWTFQLAGSLMLQGSCEKYILKRSVEAWLPAEIVWRPKRGMGVPLTQWCMQEWWPHLGEWLNPNRLREAHLWQPDLAAQIVAGKLGGASQGRRIGETLWLLVMGEMWRSQVLGQPVGKLSWNHPFWLPRSLWKYQQQWKK
jgi:asparagine synthase (glutamine-hydrolysing)